MDMIHKAGTVARCNRCNAKFTLEEDTPGTGWRGGMSRLLDMRTSNTCGHRDCHYVFQGQTGIRSI